MMVIKDKLERIFEISGNDQFLGTVSSYVMMNCGRQRKVHDGM
jgi:hypothetical protein